MDGAVALTHGVSVPCDAGMEGRSLRGGGNKVDLMINCCN